MDKNGYEGAKVGRNNEEQALNAEEVLLTTFSRIYVIAWFWHFAGG